MSRIPILCYHNVGRRPAGTRFGLLYVDPERFERQMWALRRLGLRGVSMGEGLERLCDTGGSNLAVLTFDDGYQDTLTAAAPVLAQYGFRATLYVVTDCVGGFNRWDDAYTGERKPLMDRAQIDEWLGAGMEIASHSCTHPRLEEIDDAEAGREIVESAAALQRMFGVGAKHFAYPFGGFNARTVDLVKHAGYRSAVTVQPGVACGRDDLHRLPRILVNGERGLGIFLLQVGTPFEDLRHGRALFAR